ncbi:hypothetical protein KSP39_PZI024512 [Platanthera zijinensis]|uniref:DUF4283 domain-containing protein n=1 Tax=Platanthera zijinensis TaxID=2320716 RepID=A0AAP0AS12_9ASPA
MASASPPGAPLPRPPLLRCLFLRCLLPRPPPSGAFSSGASSPGPLSPGGPSPVPDAGTVLLSAGNASSSSPSTQADLPAATVCATPPSVTVPPSVRSFVDVVAGFPVVLSDGLPAGSATPALTDLVHALIDAPPEPGSSILPPPRPISIINDLPAILFTDEEIANLAKPFNLSLVGKLSARKPSMDSIRALLSRLKLSGKYTTGTLDSRHILITFSEEKDYTRVFSQGVFYLGNSNLKILKWTPGFNPIRECPVIPIWISLTGLKLEFYNQHTLLSISRIFGKPLKLDEAKLRMTRPSKARILVELDITAKHSDKIWLGALRCGYAQTVELENVPYYCGHCACLGHSEDNCYILNPLLRPPRLARPLVDSHRKAEIPSTFEIGCTSSLGKIDCSASPPPTPASMVLDNPAPNSIQPIEHPISNESSSLGFPDQLGSEENLSAMIVFNHTPSIKTSPQSYIDPVLSIRGEPAAPLSPTASPTSAEKPEAGNSSATQFSPTANPSPADSPAAGTAVISGGTTGAPNGQKTPIQKKAQKTKNFKNIQRYNSKKRKKEKPFCITEQPPYHFGQLGYCCGSPCFTTEVSSGTTSS